MIGKLLILWILLLLIIITNMLVDKAIITIKKILKMLYNVMRNIDYSILQITCMMGGINDDVNGLLLKTAKNSEKLVSNIGYTIENTISNVITMSNKSIIICIIYLIMKPISILQYLTEVISRS